jgi:hypothetical protein
MKHGTDRHRPQGDWVGFTNATSIVGVSMRRKEAAAFADAVSEAERHRLIYGVNLQYEPNNPHDPNALAVIGTAECRGFFGGSKTREWKIGYLPREIAAEVVGELIKPGLPVGIELFSVYRGSGGYVDFKVIVLGPPGHSHSARQKRNPSQQT